MKKQRKANLDAIGNGQGRKYASPNSVIKRRTARSIRRSNKMALDIYRS